MLLRFSASDFIAFPPFLQEKCGKFGAAPLQADFPPVYFEAEGDDGK